jgi:hypothetical protein
MKQFQKIAIGLLGLTHPELFVPRWNCPATATTHIEPPHGGGSPDQSSQRQGRGARALRTFKFLVSALAIGSRTVPLADNSELRNELRNSARLIYGSDDH